MDLDRLAPGLVVVQMPRLTPYFIGIVGASCWLKSSLPALRLREEPTKHLRAGSRGHARRRHARLVGQTKSVGRMGDNVLQVAIKQVFEEDHE